MLQSDLGSSTENAVMSALPHPYSIAAVPFGLSEMEDECGQESSCHSTNISGAKQRCSEQPSLCSCRVPGPCQLLLLCLFFIPGCSVPVVLGCHLHA